MTPKQVDKLAGRIRESLASDGGREDPKDEMLLELLLGIAHNLAVIAAAQPGSAR